MSKPNRQQCQQALRAQEAVLHEANLLSSEGVGPHEIVAGIGAALADVIATSWGHDAVHRWFTSQGAMLEQLRGRQH